MNVPVNRALALLIAALNILLAIPLLIYASADKYVRFVSDDFCIASVMRENGLLGALLWSR